jgi:retron-type reverse transcriptase
MDEIMRRIGCLKESFLTFDNLYAAFRKAYRGTKNNDSYKFCFHLERELFHLRDELAEGSYVPGAYRYFTVREPKERIISVAPFRDRVVHHALVNVLEPIFERRFIYDSYATRKEKGTHRAISRAQSFVRRYRWYAKMDIEHYFASIDHAVLLSIIARNIKDNFVLDVCKSIIFRGGDGRIGLPIGNLTSQFFANVYLDRLDHYVKERLRVKGYLRYMDDFCIFHDEKDTVKAYGRDVSGFLAEELSLKLKESATLINSRYHGLPLLGVRVFPNLIRIKRENFVRTFRKLERRCDEYASGMIDGKTYKSSWKRARKNLDSDRMAGNCSSRYLLPVPQ